MDRRTFFGLIPMAAVTSKAMGADFIKSEGPIYRGYRIWEWTGWKPAQGNSLYRGQWLAAPLNSSGKYIPTADLTRERPLLYVSVPGGAESYLLGNVFDIHLYRGQREIEMRTPDHIKERERRKGLRRMFRLIDRTVS